MDGTPRRKILHYSARLAQARITPKMAEQVNKLATRLEVSEAEIVRRALAAYIPKALPYARLKAHRRRVKENENLA